MKHRVHATDKSRRIFLYLFFVSVCFLFSPQQTFAVIDWSACRTEGGTTQIDASANSKNVTLATSISNTAKAFLIVDASGTSGISGGDDHMVTGYIANTTTLTFQRSASPTTAAEISYTLVECLNDEFSVQRGEVTISSGTASNTATISSVDTSKSIVLVSIRTDDSANTEATSLATGELSNGTTVLVKRAGTPSVASIARYEVIEFTTASSVNIQTGEITLATDTASNTATISSVTGSRTWVYCSWDASNDGLQQTAIGCDLTNGTTVTAHRDNTSSFTNRIRFYTIEFPAGGVTVQRGNGNNHPGSTDDNLYNHDISITAVTAVTKAFPYLTNTTQGVGQDFPRNQWLASLSNTTTLRTTFWRGSGVLLSADNKKYWQVVEFPMAVPVTPSITSAETQERNPDLTGSAFSGQGTHVQSDWKVVTSANCVAGTSVWESLNNATNKTAITVNATTGTFVGALNGQTQLAVDTAYYACVRYKNEGGYSASSSAASFTTNVLPQASLANIDLGADAINLIANGAKAVSGTATVTDSDSCQDISTVTARLYRTAAGHDGATDNTIRYALSCSQDEGSCTGPGDTTATYTCTVNVQYYADPTDTGSLYASDNWTMRVTPSDEVATGTVSNDTIEMNSLVALTTSGATNFGTLALGADTGAANQTITVTNVGNTRLDINLSTYGSAPADNKSFACTIGTIPSANVKYSLTSFTYASAGTAMSTNPVEVDADILKPINATPSTVTLYFGLGMPGSAVGGTCSGTSTITAINDTAGD